MLLIVAGIGCNPVLLAPGDPRNATGTYAPHRTDANTLATVARRPDLEVFHKDVLVHCEGGSATAPPQCEVSLLGGPLPTEGAVAAWRFDDDRLLTFNDDLTIAFVDPTTGEREVVVEAAADPRVADDGRRITYAKLPDGTTAFAPGMPYTLVMEDLVSGETRTVSADGHGSGAIPVPESDEVLFVSGRTGVASLWLDDGSGASRQLTNRDVRDPSDGFVPVPDRDGLWLPGTRTYVYASSYAGAREVWAFDSGRGALVAAGGRPAAGARCRRSGDRRERWLGQRRPLRADVGRGR